MPISGLVYITIMFISSLVYITIMSISGLVYITKMSISGLVFAELFGDVRQPGRTRPTEERKPVGADVNVVDTDATVGADNDDRNDAVDDAVDDVASISAQNFHQ